MQIYTFSKANITICLVNLTCIVFIIFLLNTTDLKAANTEIINNNNILLDIDTQPNGRHKYSDTLSYGSKLTLEYTEENNYDLDTANNDNSGILNTEIEIALTYAPSAYFDAFIDLELVEEKALKDEADNHEHKTELNIKELNLTYRNIMKENVIFKIGRQAFKDNREWLYDEELDALRIYYRSNGLTIEASVSCDNIFSRDLLNKDERIDIYNYILLGSYHFNEDNRISAYYFIRDDQEDGERPIWTGIRATGKTSKDSKFWFDSAYVSGKGEVSDDGVQQNIHAYALDVGGTFVFDIKMEPAITLGWAYGSGDTDPTTNGDHNFRQTGLQDNNSRFNSVTRFKYYGEMLEPELSNLAISTLGLGIRPFKKTSLDLVFHKYRQDKRANTLRDSNLEEDPDGSSRDIGKGMDLIIGYRAIKDLSVEFVYSRFKPGDAFSGNAGKSSLYNLKIAYKF